jgi:hypothetical protein
MASNYPQVRLFGAVLVVVAAVLLVSLAVEARVLTEDDGKSEPGTGLIVPCALQPASFCTTDLNMCGGSSVCGCPEGYTFNQAIGLCLIDDVLRATGPGDVEVPRPGYEGVCVQATSGGCDMKVPNECGFQSVCFCDAEGGFEWSPQVGKCLLNVQKLRHN